MPERLYRLPDPDLCQGDLIDEIPHIRLTGPLTIIRQITLHGNRKSWAPYPYPPEAGNTPDAINKTIKLPPFHVKEGEFLSTHARFTRAIVLNHDCDLVKGDPEHPDRPKPDHCLVAIVRPMSGVQEVDRQTVRENRNFSFFHLPEDDDLRLDEGYADFRQITCFDPDLIETLGKRRASLTPLAVEGLQAQLFRFLVHRDLIAPST